MTGNWRTIVFKGLDHLAIVVDDTETALEVWRDRFGFPVVLSEVVNKGSIRLTHLDLGNTQLQLVQPLSADHPLWDWLEAHGTGLHHLCLAVDDVEVAVEEAARLGLPPAESRPHQGTAGKQAIFLDLVATRHAQVELTG
jgi:methylmalonyl-CoA/ethylmalonyl-CoA epimerase